MITANFPKPLNDNKRGVHGSPSQYPDGLTSDWDKKWKQELIDLKIKWFKVLDDGSGSNFNLILKLLEIGIFPVVRLYRKEPNPGVINGGNLDFIKRCVQSGVYYFETNNEPDLDLEWKKRKRPPNWLDIVVDNFIFEASKVRELGGYLLFPAFGPGGKGNPFQLIVEKGRKDLLDGNMGLAIHNYCLARPLNYPNDEVTLYGQPITLEEWQNTAIDKKQNGSLWAWEMGWDKVNEYRQKLANPNANIMDDSTCFRAFEYFDKLVNDACGHSIPIFTTEGGYNVGQRAGTTHGDDPRWPKPSPLEASKLNYQMLKWSENQGPDYYFACMPWLIAVKEIGQWQDPYEEQGPWYTGKFKYDFTGCDDNTLPIVKMLKEDKGITMKRPGIWVANGHPGNTLGDMYSWNPGALTSFYDYLGANDVFTYKRNNPQVPIIIRFQHDPDWQKDLEGSAKRLGELVASKWSNMKILDPYVYFANEMNLHYESGEGIDRQWYYESKEFYQKYANWVRITADTIKQQVPEMKLVTPPFAFGHNEDGEPDLVTGKPKLGWSGYEFLQYPIKTYFDNILTFHAYWGDSTGCIENRLYDPEVSTWYAFRWKRVLQLFEKQFNIKARLIIDEAGNFQTNHPKFTDQVIYFANECFKDDRVLALTYFLWLDPTNSPGNLPNSWVQGCQNLSQHLEVLEDYNFVNESTTPPPVNPPPVEPPKETGFVIEYKDIKKGDQLLMVGNYPRAGVEFKFSDPFGNFYYIKTGGKQVEYGAPGGTEFGKPIYSGNYKLEGDGQTFIVPSDGTKFITLKFNQPVTEKLVKWNSVAMAKTTSDSIFERLTVNERKLFSISEVK